MSAKKKTNSINPKGRLFTFRLYEDNEEHMRVLDTFKKYYMYLGLKHDRDTWHKFDKNFEEGEHYEGELKKTHHHIIVKFENARYLNALLKEIGCDDRQCVQKLGSFRDFVIYLTHRDYPQKAQYKPDEFYGLLLGDAMKCLGDDSPDVQLLEIVSYLENLNRYMSYTEFIKFCCTYGYTSTLKRFGPQIERVFNEQQGKYHAQQYENKIRKR